MPQHNDHLPSASRRRLLKGIGILTAGALCNSLFPARRAFAAAMEESGFVPVSAFLVSRPVNPILAGRYYEALQRHFPDFPAQLAALKSYLDGRHFAHVDDFLAVNDEKSVERQTASKIISAWYTGVVGAGSDLELIAFAEAMMYLPTRGILVVPTYGGGPNSWGAKPGSTEQEQGATA
ncbi:sugar dehydrogenase complex small subunit [Pantoea sp.]|uniref:sugar dehydrogenase complex small subunit n=1 Tax=Pantoea sp. TaxID=69393 RepID=UPI00289CC7F8|nr:sugar dehydrogenase complex small subunit [Pantoea sp.]